ncbi:MAG: SMP-30/gluconolactonase/LRE family protein [Alphaproteobacteria bacterium]
MTQGNSGVQLDLGEIESVGTGLSRPECVLCTREGDLYVAHMGAGVVHIAPDGTQWIIGDTATMDGEPWIPNGIAFRNARDASDGFLVANMGGGGGGVWHLAPDGTLSPHLMEVDGEPLSKANFVFHDTAGRLWITVTTRSDHVPDAMSGLGAPERADGFVCVEDSDGARIAADGITFANEARFDAKGEYFYVAETFGRRISRYRAAPDGTLSDRETFATFGHGTFADGIAFDEEGWLWVASVISNRLLRISPDGEVHTLLEDADPAHLDTVEAALAAGNVDRQIFYKPSGKALRNIASVSFGGPDLKTVYLGSLAGDSLAVFRSPVAGAPLSHW